jgi:hypothetical protein
MKSDIDANALGKFTTMTGHYKCDQSKGFSIIIEIENDPIRQGIIEMMNAYENAWVKSNDSKKQAQVNRYLNQINQYASSRGANMTSMGMLIVFNIWFMVRHGYLIENEFNGCIFSYG